MTIYHYYINYNKNRIMVKEEPYEVIDENRIKVFTDTGKHIVRLSQLKTLINSKTIYSFDRCDEFALGLFNLYIEDKITELQRSLDRFNELKLDSQDASRLEEA